MATYFSNNNSISIIITIFLIFINHIAITINTYSDYLESSANISTSQPIINPFKYHLDTV